MGGGKSRTEDWSLRSSPASMLSAGMSVSPAGPQRPVESARGRDTYTYFRRTPKECLNDTEEMFTVY